MTKEDKMLLVNKIIEVTEGKEYETLFEFVSFLAYAKGVSQDKFWNELLIFCIGDKARTDLEFKRLLDIIETDEELKDLSSLKVS